VVIAGAALYAHNRPADLNALHQGIISDYGQVNHMSAEAFDRQNADDIILLDIREADEFAISHIAGTQRIDPEISTENLLTLLPKDLTDKTIIVYCSVGRRSTALAARAKAPLLAKGAADIVNLEGGSASGSTDYIHPYNEYWSRWVKRKDKTRY